MLGAGQLRLTVVEKKCRLLPGDARGTYVADALGPDVLVELDVNAHVGGLHYLAGELLHLLF